MSIGRIVDDCVTCSNHVARISVRDEPTGWFWRKSLGEHLWRASIFIQTVQLAKLYCATPSSELAFMDITTKPPKKPQEGLFDRMEGCVGQPWFDRYFQKKPKPDLWSSPGEMIDQFEQWRKDIPQHQTVIDSLHYVRDNHTGHTYALHSIRHRSGGRGPWPSPAQLIVLSNLARTIHRTTVRGLGLLDLSEPVPIGRLERVIEKVYPFS